MSAIYYDSKVYNAAQILYYGPNEEQRDGWVFTMRFDLIGIGVLLEDLLFDTKFKHHITQEFIHDGVNCICVEAGAKEGVMRFTRSTGGSSANLVCCAYKLGDCKLGYFTKLGVDPISEWLLEDLQSHGINTDGIITVPDEFIGPGASAIITDSATKDRSILIYRGISDEIYVKDVEAKRDYLGDAEWHTISSFSNEDAFQALKKIVQIEKDRGVKLFFTPSMSMITPLLDQTLELARDATIVSMNDTEVKLLAGMKDHRRAAAKIQSLGPEIVLVTCGKQGLILVDEKKVYVAESTYDVNVRNTVGAGDASAAALWHYLEKGLDRSSVLQRVLAAGALKIQWSGAKAGLPTENEIEEFIQEKGEIPVISESR
jgi:sugar/nucleoside kinase (ribokinase family)